MLLSFFLSLFQQAVATITTEDCECGITGPQARIMTREQVLLFLDQSNQNKIVDGIVALPGEFPWIVSLEYFGHYYCGGSIISDRLVLTAAHCIKPNFPIYVRLGDHDKLSTTESKTELIGARPVLHPHYGRRGQSLGSDIAVLWLDKRIDFSEYDGRVGPVCLAHQGLFENDPVVAAGWGLTTEEGKQSRILQKVELVTMSNDQCFNKTGYSVIPEYMDSSMLCAGAPGKDTCSGDSGGPLITWNADKGRWVLVAVISWGVGCARQDYPGVYCRIVSNLEWIDEQMKKSKSVQCKGG